MKRIAIIPARAGSKRIPGKNSRIFMGKPIIAYIIETVVKSNLFDEVMVSTDSKEIAAIANKYGATTPYVRSEVNSNDTATTSQVLIEVLENYKKDNVTFDMGCCIYPTAVLITSEKLKEGLSKLEKGINHTVISVLKFSHPIQRALRISNEKLEMLWPENKTVRSQDLEPVYHDAGQFYFFRPELFLKEKQLITSDSGYVLLSENEAQDIDNEEDWKMAEQKFKLIHKFC